MVIRFAHQKISQLSQKALTVITLIIFTEFLQNLRVLLADPLNDDDPCEKFYGVQMDRVNEFASPYYPQKYPPNMECIRVISAPRGHDIVVFFEDTFQIESSFEGITTKGATASTAPCLNDYIEARDGWYGFSPLIGRFCGNLLPSNELRAHSGAMWLHFHSDDALQYRGFRARYQFARSHTPSTTKRSASECYFAHSFSLDGYIDAAQFRSYYESNRIASGDMAECVWRIEMPKKMTVSLFVEELSLGVLNDCTANSVEIYAGNTANSPLQRLCGTSSGNTMTNNHIVYIRMQAYGGAVAAMHVRILYSAFLTEDACYANEGFRCGDGTCVPGVLVCNSRYNCLYRSDERSCHYGKSVIRKLTHDSRELKY
ncbi:hypothetical protein AB6A40_001915 [Gnathostoma spinigerum]|uniref:CUB domain-containing protein n=1 Tax=Gnathostoma spinigerum TaxID=75299 RepID=A0ABD6ECW3_9BILA